MVNRSSIALICSDCNAIMQSRLDYQILGKKQADWIEQNPFPALPPKK